MFCNECGEQLEDTAKFCAKCGAKLPEKRFAEEPVVKKPDTEGAVKKTLTNISDYKGINHITVINGFPANSDGYVLSYIPGVFAYSQLRAFYAFKHCNDKTPEQIDRYVEKARKEYEAWFERQSKIGNISN